MKGTSPTPGYTTRQVARLLGLPARRVRYWVTSGLVSPRRGGRREYRFSFQDLVVLRAAEGLVEAKIAPQRARRALERLHDELPPGRSLAAVRIAAEGGRVVVRKGGDAWEPESGQRPLDFAVSELAERAAPLAYRAAERARRAELDADGWYDLAFELEATAPDEARAAYRRVLELAPEHFEAHLDLGRLLHEEGEPSVAEEHYRAALALRPDEPTALFNLGVALQDLDRREEAIATYRRLLDVDSRYADAHFNLAGLYEEEGRSTIAIRHLKAYKLLTGGGSA